MKPRLIAILISSLFVASPVAFAAEGLTWTGSVSLGGRYLDDNTQDPSKLNEYRDLQSGVIGNFELRGRSDSYYFQGYAENISYDDYWVDLKGGKYGSFKYQLYSNGMQHNFGSGPGALSPYAGIGGSVLTANFPKTNVGTWNTFDHSYTRRDTGGMFELSLNSPWYVRFDVNEVSRQGINVFNGAQGTSPGNGFVDLPAPIDYVTRNYTAEGGYQAKNWHVAANVLYSKFENDNPVLRWSNGFFNAANVPGSYDTTVLPPSNEMWRFGANGNVRKLFWDSTLAGRLTYSKLTNSVNMRPTMLGAGNTNPATGSNSPTFNGEIEYKTVSLSLSSHPIHDLDTRVYWNWAEEKNNSTRMVFSPALASGLLGGASPNCSTSPAGVGTPCTPELFGYKKNNLGIDAAYRINSGNKISGGYDYYDIERERIDFTRNIDHKWYVEYKNSMLEQLTGRIKYQFLDRSSTWAVPQPVWGPPTNYNPTEFYVRRFDLANVKQDLLKVVLDYTPLPFMDVGFEGIYKKNDYKDTALGRTSDDRQEYYLSFSFGDPNKLRLLVFGDIELMNYDSTHRVGGTTLANSNPAAPPSGAPVSTIYTWNAENQDKSWQYGLGVDWLPMERLKLNGSFIWAKTQGTTDFTAQAGTLLSAPFIPISNFDNTKTISLNLKGNYKVDRNWSVTGGYAYQRYDYSDIGYDGNRYVTPYPPAAASSSTSYVTGQYAYQPYKANIFYAYGTYKF